MHCTHENTHIFKLLLTYNGISMYALCDTHLIASSHCDGSRNRVLKMHRARSLAVTVFLSLNAFDFAEVPAVKKQQQQKQKQLINAKRKSSYS